MSNITVCDDCSWPDAESCCCEDADDVTGLCDLHTDARSILAEMDAEKA